MMKVILYFYEKAIENIDKITFFQLEESNIFSKLIKIKYETTNQDIEKFDEYLKKIDLFFNKTKR